MSDIRKSIGVVDVREIDGVDTLAIIREFFFKAQVYVYACGHEDEYRATLHGLMLTIEAFRNRDERKIVAQLW